MNAIEFLLMVGCQSNRVSETFCAKEGVTANESVTAIENKKRFVAIMVEILWWKEDYKGLRNFLC